MQCFCLEVQHSSQHVNLGKQGRLGSGRLQLLSMPNTSIPTLYQQEGSFRWPKGSGFIVCVSPSISTNSQHVQRRRSFLNGDWTIYILEDTRVKLLHSIRLSKVLVIPQQGIVLGLHNDRAFCNYMYKAVMRTCATVLQKTEAFCDVMYLCTEKKIENRRKKEGEPLVELQPCRKMPQRVLAESCYSWAKHNTVGGWDALVRLPHSSNCIIVACWLCGEKNIHPVRGTLSIYSQAHAFYCHTWTTEWQLI